MKIKPRKIMVYRFDIEHSLKEIQDDNRLFPYRFIWRAIGKKVKDVRVICNKDKAIYIDIQYFED